MTNGYNVTIGLEVHAQLLTRSKMFCSCGATYGEPPNTRTCPVCLGLPGALPAPNRAAIEMAAKVGIAAGCRIAHKTKFDRKNYFYPDLPKGYQISQFDMPLCEGGTIQIRGSFGTKEIGIIRMHLEEDAGKSLHGDEGGTLVDLNRCGMPLVEIVSAPDMKSPEEAYAYLTEVRRLVRWLEVCDGNLEEGSLRCDANISVSKTGAPLGTPVEVKNLNSFRGVERAIKFEINRQCQALEEGRKITRMTMLWDEDKGETRPMRSKEAAHDYRYFPEPDLVVLELSETMLQEILHSMVELPWNRRERFVKLGVKGDDADIITSDLEFADFFEDLLQGLEGDVARAARWTVGEAMRWRKELGRNERFVVDSDVTARVAKLEMEGKISGLAAKTIYEELARTGRDDPEKLMQERGLEQVSDSGSLEAEIRRIIDENPKEVERFRAGDQKLRGFFVGQVMKATGGKADPKLTGEILKRLLS